jgi:hypothetical protein
MEYAKYAKVFPLAQALKFKVPSKWYRRAVGGTEIFSGEQRFSALYILQR